MINDAGLTLIRKWEGSRLGAYKDAKGIWTIGYGHTAAAGGLVPKRGVKITQDEAERILARDLPQYERAVAAAIRHRMNENQFAACVSLCFNIGTAAFARSSVVRRWNANDVAGAANAFLMWTKAGKKTLKGLVARRKAERELFLTPSARIASPWWAPEGRAEPLSGQPPDAPPTPAPPPEYTPAAIRDVQTRLLGHGYVQVGAVDGLMGDKTRSAIRDFRAKNSLPEGDGIDAALLVALRRPDAVRPVILPERANATLDDLQEKGSVIADSSKKSSKGAIATIAAGVGTVGSQIVESAGGLTNLGPALMPFKTLFDEYGVYVLGTVIVVMGGVIWWQARRAGAARLKDHRSGNTSVVNLPDHE